MTDKLASAWCVAMVPLGILSTVVLTMMGVFPVLLAGLMIGVMTAGAMVMILGILS